MRQSRFSKIFCKVSPITAIQALLSENGRFLERFSVTALKQCVNSWNPLALNRRT
jgi:hypothetical protein